MDTWKMANFLEKMHAHKNISVNHLIRPKNIPVTFFRIALNIPAKFVCYVFDDVVVSHWFMRDFYCWDWYRCAFWAWPWFGWREPRQELSLAWSDPMINWKNHHHRSAFATTSFEVIILRVKAYQKINLLQ